MEITFSDAFWLVPFGAAVGFIGSIVGLGGGFVIVPFLFMTCGMEKEPAVATSITVVVLTALSSTVANARKRRIDVRLGFVLAAGTIPGAILGPKLLPLVPEWIFGLCFSALMFFVAFYLSVVTPARREVEGEGVTRLQERDGTVHVYRASLWWAGTVSLLAGFVASMGGVGGGAVHMPVMILLFLMPPVIASASSQMALLITASVASAGYALEGQVVWPAVAMLGGGVVVGAQAGVCLAKGISRKWFKRFLAVVIAIVAIQMILRSLGVLA